MKKLMGVVVGVLALVGSAWAAVNINTASVAELDGVPGIGPGKARAIVEYRQKHGPFRTVDDLVAVKGMGAKTVEKLRPQLTVGSRPAAPATPARKD